MEQSTKQQVDMIKKTGSQKGHSWRKCERSPYPSLPATPARVYFPLGQNTIVSDEALYLFNGRLFLVGNLSLREQHQKSCWTLKCQPRRTWQCPGPPEAQAGVADRVREQQSPECACARERDKVWSRAAGHADEVGVTPA